MAVAAHGGESAGGDRRMFSRLLLIAALTLPMGACVTAREIEASDDEMCRNAGKKPGTPEYAKCRENISSQRQMAARIGMQNLTWSLQGH
jgi:hypothetical protein